MILELLRHPLFRLSALCGTATALLVSCGDQAPQNLERLVDDTPGKTLEPLPSIDPERPFAYAARNLRDPFQPLNFSTVANTVQPDRNRPEEPLEKYALESLKLVGIVQINGYWALIKAPDGATHRARKGNYLGLNQGRIVDIGKRRLYLRETVTSDDRTQMEREAVLSLDE